MPFEAADFRAAIVNQPVNLPQTQVMATVEPTQILQVANYSLITAYMGALLVTQANNAPAFTSHPSSAGQVLMDTAGQSFYVAQAVLGRWGRNGRWPDVSLERKDNQVMLHANFDLNAPGTAASALPLPLTGFQVTLRSKNLPQPLVMTTEAVPPPEGSTTTYVRLAARAQVDLNQILGVLQEDPTALFEIQANANYRFKTGGGGGQGSVVFNDNVIVDYSAFKTLRAANLNLMPIKNIPGMATSTIHIPTYNPPPQTPEPTITTESKILILGNIPAYFPTGNKDNWTVYAKVNSAFSANPDIGWVRTPHGLIRESPIPHQYYILPDSYGLAYDLERQLPGVMTLLIADSGAGGTGVQAYKIRLRLSVKPQYDMRRLAELRNYLATFSGEIYPDLRAGGYEKATFSFTQLLNNLGQLVGAASEGEAGEVVDAANGFEVVLDCNNQTYNLLQTWLRSSGVEGKVQITLQMDDNTQNVSDIPTRLKLAQPATHPLKVEIVADETDQSPDAVIVSNPSSFAANVSGIDCTLLFVDSNIPYPIDALPGMTTPATFFLDPGASIQVAVKPPEETPEAIQGALWGAVAANLIDVQLQIDPDAVLGKIHELTPATDLKSRLNVWSFLLKHPDRLTGPLADVYGLDVEIRMKDKPAVQVSLTLDNPEQPVDLAFTFQDLVAGLSPLQPSFEFRQRNLAGANPGPWSTWETRTGSDLQVAPVSL